MPRLSVHSDTAAEFAASLLPASGAVAGLDPAVVQAFDSLGVQPKQIGTGSFGLFPTLARTAPTRGTRELLEAYATMPWLRAAGSKIAMSVAATDWTLSKVSNARQARSLLRQSPKKRARRKAAFRKEMALEPILDHPLLDLLEAPNEWHPGLILFELAQLHLDLVGEAFWLKERNDNGSLRRLWPLPPTWVVQTPKLEEEPSKQFFVIEVSGQRTPIPRTDMVWFYTPDPAKPYGRGVGVGRALGDELDTDEFSAKYIKQWFFNGAVPDVIVSADDLNSGDTKRLEQIWLEKNQGFWNRHKPFFLARKVDVTKLSSTFKDTQIVELRKHERDTIIQVYGVPPEKIGIIESSNRSTSEAADVTFAKDVLVPRLELMRVFMQVYLVNEVDPTLVLDYDSPVQQDSAHQLEVMKAQPHAFTVDQWQEAAGYEPLPDGKGERFFVPFSLQMVSDLDELSVPSDAQVASKAKTKQLEEIEEQLIAETLEAIRNDAVTDAVEPIIRELVTQFGDEMADELGTVFLPDDPAVVEYLRTNSAEKIVGITDTTKARVRRQIVRGVREGEGVQAIARRIEGVFAEARGSRAFTIARTETVSGANFGANHAMVQADVPRKKWLPVRDGVLRRTHAALGNAAAIPVTDNFVSPSGASGPHPGALGTAEEDVNCRCTIIPVLSRREFTATELDARWRTFEAERQPHEAKLRVSLRRAFGSQEKAALAAFRRAAR